jgi:hypothetical protein
MTRPNWDRLSEQERDAILARSLARKKTAANSRKERKAARLELVRRINGAFRDGMNQNEVALHVGITVAVLITIRRNWGIPLMTRPGHRRVYAWIRDEEFDALDELAVDMETDPSSVLTELLTWLLGNHASPARRELQRIGRKFVRRQRTETAA